MPVPARLKRYEDAWHRAVETVHHRRLQDSLIKRQMIDASERYNHSIVYPLPDVEGEPTFPPIAAAIIADAIDSFATRANDTTPTITAPAINPAALTSRNKADLRGQAWGASWHESKLPLVMARTYRQLFGYGTYCLYVEANHATKRPVITSRDPMLAYPEPMGNDEVRVPRDVGFVYGRSPQWLLERYPDAASIIQRNTTADDDLWDVLDWTDGDLCMIGILAKRGAESYWRRYDSAGRYSYYGDQPVDQCFLLAAYPNRAGMVPGVCPTAVTLDRLVSSITRIVPITDVMNKVAALNFISAEKGVFPHIVVLGDQGEEPQIVGGQFKDGRSGDANLITGAKNISALSMSPSPASQTLMSDLERAARMSSSNPAMFQGELTGSVRSGQTVSQLAGISIDPRVKEAHNIMGYALSTINEAVAAVQVGYWPRRKYTVFSGWAGTNRHVKYAPADIWEETKESVVAYPLPGLDAQGATVVLGQLNQARFISRATARRHHPLVGDPDVQEQQLMEESLDDAIAMTAVGLVTSGSLAWTDLAVIRGKVREGKPIEEAVAEAQEEAQERQASQAPVPDPGMGAPPGAMPGLNTPEAGGQMMMPPGEAQAPPPTEDEQFAALTGALMAQPGAAPGPV